MSTDLIDQLRSEWFKRFDQIVEYNKNLPSSNLQCLELCQARCCPRVGMRAMDARQIASPVVVLLPFEMEYIINKTGVSPDVFRRWPLALTPEVTIEVGMLDLGKPCPFLDPSMRTCTIHEHNPLDCRTFPLLPFQNAYGGLEWELGENCPSLSLLSPKFADAIKHIWQEIHPLLPQDWWDIYNFADHWTGWVALQEICHVS